MFFQVTNGTKDLLTLQHGIDWHRHFSPCHTVSPQQKNAMFLVSLLCSWKSCIAISHCPRGSTCFFWYSLRQKGLLCYEFPKPLANHANFIDSLAYLWLLSGQFVHPWLGTPPNLDIYTLKSKQALQVTWRHNPAHPAKIDVQHVEAWNVGVLSDPTSKQMGDFLKWWVSPTTMGFHTRNDHFGVWNGGTTSLGNTQICQQKCDTKPDLNSISSL